MQRLLGLGVLGGARERRAVEVVLQHAALEPRGVLLRRGHVVERHYLGARAERHAQRARVRPGARTVRAELLRRVLEERGAINIPLAVDHVRRAVEEHVEAVAAVQEPHELQLGRRHAVGRELDGDLDVGDGEAVEEGVGRGDGMRECGRPTLQDVWVCERGVDGHVLPIPVVRRKQEPLRVEHVRVGAAERHDDVSRRRRGERDPVAVAERRTVDAGPDRQRLAAHGGEGDVVLDDLARHRSRASAVIISIVRARHEPYGVVAVAGEHGVVGDAELVRRGRGPVGGLDRAVPSVGAVDGDARKRVDVALDLEAHGGKR
mmetsp:Transcript_2114/g.6843  ORF Transcript_2114/g.6843 Transcript_2114/m.6843 type:complete len:319 (-) Transcript_2114:1611-2567(-)